MDNRVEIDQNHRVLNDDLDKNLAALANDIEKTIASRRLDLEAYRKFAQTLSDLRSLIFELTETKGGKKLLPLFERFFELEGKLKEMRNDLTCRNLS